MVIGWLVAAPPASGLSLGVCATWIRPVAGPGGWLLVQLNVLHQATSQRRFWRQCPGARGQPVSGWSTEASVDPSRLRFIGEPEEGLLRFFGDKSSRAFVRAPEGMGGLANCPHRRTFSALRAPACIVGVCSEPAAKGTV